MTIPALLTPVLPLLPEVFLAVMALILTVLGVAGRDEDDTAVSRLAVFSLLVAAAVTAFAPPAPGSAFGGMFMSDAFTSFMKTIVLLAAAAAAWMAQGFGRFARMARFEFPLLILLSTLGMMLSISAGSLIALYVGLELQSLALYVLAAFRRDDVRSTEAGLKYFVLGALSSGLLLYGASMVYGYTGSVDFAQIAQALSGAAPAGAVVGMVLMLCALAFKISAVPFHMWAPDVYEGAPASAAAFFAMAPKVAGLAVFARIVTGPFAPLAAEGRQVVIALCLASMVLGAVAAVTQTNLRRLLAYSSIGHVGYALAALTAGGEKGLSALALYAALYALGAAGAFAVVLMMRREGQAAEKIEDLAGLSRAQPGVALAFSAVLFSLAGIPPLAGFFGKLYAFEAAVNAGLYTVAVVGVLSSVVAAYYYLRLIKVMYVDEAAGRALDSCEEFAPRGVLALSALGLSAFILFPGWLSAATKAAAAALLPG